MEKASLDTLKTEFESALQMWILRIQRLLELLRNTTHSPRSEDVWKQADLELANAENAMKEARQAYETAVREANFGF